MHLLVDDLGATLYRVDIWGKSDWIDPTGQSGPSALEPAHLAAVYQGEIFQRGWALMRWLNSRGIQPYLTASGDVPAWMLAEDGRTLKDLESFGAMLVSMLVWAKKKENLRFTLFGPLNETDIGQPEGPLVDPATFLHVGEILDRQMAEQGLDDIRLVVAEQADFNPHYLLPMADRAKMVERIGVLGLHTYRDIPAQEYQQVLGALQRSPLAACRLWMTEFGDLEQTGEREWYVAWAMTSRLLDLLEAGFNAALAWDAFDNLHDHDSAWTIYGLLRTGLRLHTPKKRYHALKHVFRFVPPGFERIELASPAAGVRMLAFADPARERFTLVGMNLSGRNVLLNVKWTGFAALQAGSQIVYYRTTEIENCSRVEEISTAGGTDPLPGMSAFIPPDCIFNLSNVL
jgi:hypothetical protein